MAKIETNSSCNKRECEPPQFERNLLIQSETMEPDVKKSEQIKDPVRPHGRRDKFEIEDRSIRNIDQINNREPAEEAEEQARPEPRTRRERPD